MRKTQSQLKLVKQGKYDYIFIYYKLKDTIIRINTGNEVIKSCLRKDLLYNTKMKDYEKLNDKTLKLKRKVDNYISYRLENGWKFLTQEECGAFVKSEQEDFRRYLYSGEYYVEFAQTRKKTLNDYLEEFYNFKKDVLNNRASYKDYLSMANSIKDYQKQYGNLSIYEMNNEEFLIKYRNFLAEKRGDGCLTKGGLGDNTINKRFATLRSFYRWLEKHDVYKFKESVYDFSIPKYDNEIIVLSKAEIKKLKELDIENGTWIKIIDVFICNCFLGLRYSDLNTLHKSHFSKDSEGDYVLIKENIKTGTTLQIPVQKTSLEILKKYNFELPKFSHQYFNRALTDIFEKHELFSEQIVKKRRVNKANKDEIYLKRELIKSHTCRRTFITLSISENVPFNVIMLATGHKKIQTLQKYIKPLQDKESFKRIDL